MERTNFEDPPPPHMCLPVGTEVPRGCLMTLLRLRAPLGRLSSPFPPATQSC